MKTTTMSLAALAGALFVGMTACSAPTESDGRVTYENTIRKLTVQQCRECHGPKAPTLAEFKKDKKGYTEKDQGPRMDTYANLMIFVNGPDTGAVMRRLDDGKNTKDGKPGNMYEKLGETAGERAANLALFKKWIGGWTLKRSREITEAERKAILAPER